MKFYYVVLFAMLFSCAQNPNSNTENDEGNTTTSPASHERSSGEVPEVNVRQFEKLRVSGSAIVIDVRTPKEIADGKVPDALEIDYESDDFESKINSLDKDKSYMVYCEAGGRSSKATEMMLQKGFKNVYNLEGGYKAWEKQAVQ